MAKKTAADLNLKAEVIEGTPTTMDDVPDEYTPGPPPPYPGSYRFKPPANFAALWDKFESADPRGAKDKDGNPVKVERLSLVFDKDDPLVITQAPADQAHLIGTQFTTRINNKERNRAKKNDPPLFVADMLYLLRAWSETQVPKTNQEYVALVMKHAGKEFGADVEWTTNCNEERQIFIEVQKQDGAGNPLVDAATGQALTELLPGVDAANQPVKGCGARYYMNNWPKGSDGRYLPRMTCSGKDGRPCGASLRPFGQLRNFRA
jgi:hypothetical protein